MIRVEVSGCNGRVLYMTFSDEYILDDIDGAMGRVKKAVKIISESLENIPKLD